MFFFCVSGGRALLFDLIYKCEVKGHARALECNSIWIAERYLDISTWDSTPRCAAPPLKCPILCLLWNEVWAPIGDIAWQPMQTSISQRLGKVMAMIQGKRDVESYFPHTLDAHWVWSGTLNL